MKDRQLRRLPLRQLMTHSLKDAHDLAEQLRTDLGPLLSEFRTLSRPNRKRSSYPTMTAMRNALAKVRRASEEMQRMTQQMEECLQEIKRHCARRQSLSG
jgi:hypothetical protein